MNNLFKKLQNARKSALGRGNTIKKSYESILKTIPNTPQQLEKRLKNAGLLGGSRKHKTRKHKNRKHKTRKHKI